MSAISAGYTRLQLLALSLGTSFRFSATFPVGIDLTGKTVAVRIRNTDESKEFTKTSATAGISISAQVVSVDIPPTMTSDSSGTPAFSTLQGERLLYRIDVLNADTTIYHRFKGDIVWSSKEGEGVDV